jgi:hypothetical protein
VAAKLDMDKIARGLGAERRGRVANPEKSGGYFGAMQLLADIQARFRVPAGGGRATDPQWTERRLVPLAPRTLERLGELTARVQEQSGVRVEPMQLAALLLEDATARLDEHEAGELLQTHRQSRRKLAG